MYLFRELPTLQASLWNRCLLELEAEMPEQQFNTWVRPLQAVVDGSMLRLLAPNRFVLEWVCEGGMGRAFDIRMLPPIPTSLTGRMKAFLLFGRRPRPFPHLQKRRQLYRNWAAQLQPLS